MRKLIVLPVKPDKTIQDIYVSVPLKKTGVRVIQTLQELEMFDYTLYEFKAGKDVTDKCYGFGCSLQRQYYMYADIVTIYKLKNVITPSGGRPTMVGLDRFYLDRPYEPNRFAILLERLEKQEYIYIKNTLSPTETFFDNA